MDQQSQDYDQKEKETQTTQKRLICYTKRRSSVFNKEINSNLNPTPQSQMRFKIAYQRRCKAKPRYHTRRRGMRNTILEGKPKLTLQMISDTSLAKCQSSSKILPQRTTLGDKCQSAADIGESRIMARRRRRKRKKNNVVRDEASHLRRRARYLLIKMKQEQNLIDAYTGDGWKGRSREKLKPVMELQRARKEILKCKLGIRDAIRQLDLLKCEEIVEDSVVDADENVSREHIFCAKCKSREAFPDNDIMLCDGQCNRRFHQRCLDPQSGKIPTDQGWFCTFCECKRGILDVINAHLGTCFSVNSCWEDIFKEATNPDADNACLNPTGEWPSEDSADEDYDPDTNCNNHSRTATDESESSDACSSSGVYYTSDEASSYSNRPRNHFLNGTFGHIINEHFVDSGEAGDCDITNYRRQRRDVDYKKLHDEMFGKERGDKEQSEEDEDWGPHRRKRRRDAGCVDENGCSSTAVKESVSRDKKPVFRIPTNAVEKLRQVFAENELPSRTIRENLSKQLGLDSDKVGRWFRNARYAALKSRKSQAQISSQLQVNNPTEETDTDGKNSDEVVLDKTYLLPLSSIFHLPRNFKRAQQRKNAKSRITPLSKRHRSAANLPADKIQKLQEVLAENRFPSISVQRKLSHELDLPSRQVSQFIRW
ncbi:Zinc finger RING/FYVE/PHD-type protein [Dioscorea alata]|uniref:Zinc finger RING/FYVE/PHD-type protein n=2 Tax=Dioscorea alata TaxID=55571 RepID=A0ACB7VKW6_DIOAL|nr:Zinc finger RING/FYVE/PHD-type protein [Dioscorea alata]KAH7674695.1 Zinc finger RING/FYVE/PHD-type protein [Dioscorea alata]